MDVTAEETGLFQYTPLALTQTAFRLLRLWPKSNTCPHLRLELFDADTTQWTDKYVAGSYAWGEDARPQTILVNERAFKIGQNLYDFMTAYEDHPDVRYSSAGLVMWIDAICIDQESIKGKNHQVSIMNKIYKNAKSVYSWLGPGTRESDWLFRCLRGIALPGPEHGHKNYPKLYIKRAWEIVQPCFHAEASENTSSTCPLAPFDRNAGLALSTMAELFNRAYFKRLWIVQEIVLARHVELLCGSESVAFTVLYSHARELSCLFGLTWGVRKSLQPPGFCENACFRLYEQRALSQSHEFETLFRDFGSLLCKVKHDKIYAFLGLLSDSEPAKSLVILYDSPIVEVVQEIIRLGVLSNTPIYIGPDRLFNGTSSILSKIVHQLQLELSPAALLVNGQSTFLLTHSPGTELQPLLTVERMLAGSDLDDDEANGYGEQKIQFPVPASSTVAKDLVDGRFVFDTVAGKHLNVRRMPIKGHPPTDASLWYVNGAHRDKFELRSDPLRLKRFVDIAFQLLLRALATVCSIQNPARIHIPWDHHVLELFLAPMPFMFHKEPEGDIDENLLDRAIDVRALAEQLLSLLGEQRAFYDPDWSVEYKYTAFVPGLGSAA